jgi:hypothetical protein
MKNRNNTPQHKKGNVPQTYRQHNAGKTESISSKNQEQDKDVYSLHLNSYSNKARKRPDINKKDFGFFIFCCCLFSEVLGLTHARQALYHLSHTPSDWIWFLRWGRANFAQASLELMNLLPLPPR